MSIEKEYEELKSQDIPALIQSFVNSFLFSFMYSLHFFMKSALGM